MSNNIDEKHQKQHIIIHSIECENFKSFYGKVILGPFDSGMSCIIGPNGSGKSNVIDSLLFVFGYKASKIRSKKLAVLIHKSSKEISCKLASVAVNFRIFTNIHDTNHQELSIKRIVFQNNTSNYYINNKLSNFKEVTNLLMENQIDLYHSRFLILQGEVEQIAQMKPKRQSSDNCDGMLEYIEEIIGTNILAEPIDIYESRLNTLKEYEGYLTNQKQNAELELKKLDETRNKVLEYLELENEKNYLNFILNQRKLDQEIEILNLKDKEIFENKNLISKFSDEINDLIIKIENQSKMKLSYTKKSSNLKKRINDLEKLFIDHEANDSKLQTLIKHFRKEKKIINDKLIEMQQQLDEEYCVDEKKIEDKANDLRNLIDETEKSISKCRKHLDIALENFESETRTLQNAKEEEMKQIAPLLDENNILKLKASELMNEISKLQNERDLLIKNIDESEKEYSKLNAKQQEQFEEIKNMNLELEKYKTALKNVESDSKEIEDKINRLQIEISYKNEILAQNQNLVSNSRISKDLKNLLNFLDEQQSLGKINGKVFGRLGDFLVTKKKFDIAISTSSSRFDNIVVDSIDTAVNCIDLMKENSAGTASFICLDKISKNVPQKQNVGDKIDGVRLFDLVECLDEKLVSAAYFAIGDAILSKDIDCAQKLAFGSKKEFRNRRIITLKGQIIESNGAMCGGGEPTCNKIRIKENSNESQSEASLKKTASFVNVLSLEDLSKLSEKINKMVDEVSNLQSMLRNSHKVRVECQTHISRISSKIVELNQQNDENMFLKTLENAKTKISSCKNDFEKFQNEKSDLLDIKQHEHGKLLKKLQKSLDKYSKQKLEHDRICSELEAIQNRLLDPLRLDLDKKEKLQVEQKQKLTKCTYEEAKLLREEFLAKINNLKNKEEEITIKFESTEQEIKQNEEKALLTSNEIHELKLELEVLDKEFKKNNNLESEDEDHENYEKKLLNLKLEIKKLNEKISLAKNDSIEIKIKIENLNNSINRLFINDMVSGEKHFIDDEYKNKFLQKSKEQEIFDLSFEELNEKILKISESLTKIPSPNITILSEFTKSLKNFNEKKNLLEFHIEKSNEQKKLRDQLKSLRLSLFNKSLVILNKHLKYLYHSITMGGTAELELVDFISPFSQGLQMTVMPPRKAWKIIGNLSGGEKTLSSLALLFALHAVRPSPFYILDEIDAALDFRNVAIIASYLKWQSSQNTQFLVISLREEMYSKAERFIAVYKFNDISRSLAVHNFDNKNKDNDDPKLSNICDSRNNLKCDMI